MRCRVRSKTPYLPISNTVGYKLTNSYNLIKSDNCIENPLGQGSFMRPAKGN